MSACLQGPTRIAALTLGALICAACAAPAQRVAQAAAPAVAAPSGKPVTSPPWQQGRPAELAQSPLAPFATPVAPMPAEQIPLSQLRVPPGFKIELWASGIHNARSLALGANGTVFVGSRVAGNVYAVIDRGNEREVKTIAHGLTLPNGIAFRDGALFVTETTRVLRFDDIEGKLDAPPAPAVAYSDLPAQSAHNWRYTAFGPDGGFYISVGAPCNICVPPAVNAQIRRVDLATGASQIVARGVRNSIGFDWHPQTKELWFTDNGRDWAQADRVPDELNRVAHDGQDFGFPYCHGGDFVDPELGAQHSCEEFVAPVLKLGPNVAALGLHFYSGTMFPPEYRGNIFIAERGSWNRERKTGFTVMRVALRGNEIVAYEPFVSGWMNEERFWGRPVDLLVLRDGSMLIADDHAGAIFRVSYDGTQGASSPDATEQASSKRAAQLQDLEVARTEYVLKSQAFSTDGRRRALQLIDELEARAGEISDIEFFVAIHKLAALTGNAHDAVNISADALRPTLRLPFRMLWFPDGPVIARAAPQAADLLGARVVSIEGHDPNQILAQLAAIDGGTPEFRSWHTMWGMEHAEVLRALGLAENADRLRLQVVLAGGQAVTRTVTLMPARNIPKISISNRLWLPAPTATEAAQGWRAAIDPVRAPLYLQNPDRLFVLTALPELDAMYLQMRLNMSFGDEKVEPFIDSVRTSLATASARNVIVDLRFNQGGDIDTTRDLLREIVARVPGRLYVLIGRYTFSAGIVAAAALKHDGGDRVTLVGETIGDRLQFWSETHDPACLPNSRLCLLPTTGYWDLQHGCKDQPGCYGDPYDAIVADLAPQLRAPLTSADWLAGRDPGMEAVARDLAKK